MNQAEKQSPLAAFSDDSRPFGEVIGVDIQERPFQGYFNLRCDVANADVAEALEQSLGVSLPTLPNKTASGEDVNCYWLGPDEWLLRLPSEDDTSKVDAVSKALKGQLFSLTDLSSAMTQIHVSGASARDVLCQGTPLDLNPGVFTLGQCAQTVLAKSHVLIAPSDSPKAGFELIVRRSFADYLLLFLRDAAHDYGYQFSR